MRPRSARGSGGRDAERAGAQEDELPVGLGRELANERTEERPLGLTPFEHDDVPLLPRLEALEVDPERHELVGSREALGRGAGRLLARREERVEAAAKAVPACPPLRVRKTLGREERRNGQGRRVAQRDIREARQPGLEAVHDVVAAAHQRVCEVRLHADGDSHAAPAGDRHGRADRHELVVLEVAGERTAARCQVTRAVRRRQHGYPVAPRAKLPCEPCDVLVHVVRLRPREGRDEGDRKCHRSCRV